MKGVKILTLFLGAVCSPAFGLIIHEPGYVGETYAKYSPTTTQTHSMTFDNTGRLYTNQPYDDKIYQILTDGTVNQFASIGDTTSGFEWTGGTSYGDYLYVTANTTLVRIAPDGTSSTFASGFPAASEAAVDRTGNYGGFLYISTGGQDRIYRVDTSGGVSVFSNWPGTTNGGGPLGMEFDETGEYGGLMYVGTTFGASAASKSGVFALDTDGSASRFAGNIAVGFDIGFDTQGFFGLDMFVVGASDFGEAFGLWRVAPDGTATKFATTTESLIGSVVFGPEGAMYISEYSIASKEITITKVIPEPATLLLLGLGGLGLLRRRRLSRP